MPDTAEHQDEFVASLYKGGELLSANKVVEAREHLEQANKLNPKNEKARNLLGLAYFKLGLFDQASEVYEGLVRDNPVDPTLRVNLGLVYLKTNNLERSVREFETATDLDPEHKKAHNYLGLALAQAGDYVKARDHFVLAGSDAMADKMSKALASRTEAESPSAPVPVAAEPAAQPASKAQASDDDEMIEVMSDEQEPPSGESPITLEAEEVAVEVAPEGPVLAGSNGESHTSLTELPADEAGPAPVKEMARPSQPSLQAADWGEQLAKAQPQLEVGDEDPLIEATADDFPADVPVDEYGEPVTAAQYGSASKSDIRRAALAGQPGQAWVEPEPRELVSVESMTPEPMNEVPLDNSWSASGSSGDLMAEAAESFVSSDTPFDPNAHQSTEHENDWGSTAVVAQEAASEAQAVAAGREQMPMLSSSMVAMYEPVESPPHDAVPLEDTTPLEAEVARPVDGAPVARPGMNWGSVASETEVPTMPGGQALRISRSVGAPEPEEPQMPDWVASAPDPLAPVETAAPEPEWVSQPLSEVNFTASGHSRYAGAGELTVTQGPGSSTPAEPPAAAGQAQYQDPNEPYDRSAYRDPNRPSAEGEYQDPNQPPGEGGYAAEYQDPNQPYAESGYAAEYQDPNQPYAEGEYAAQYQDRNQPYAEDANQQQQPYEAAAYEAGADQAFAEPPEPARATVPTYEPEAVTQPPYVDISLTPAHHNERSVASTEPHGVAAVAAQAAPTGYSPMGSQRLLDLGVSTQWVAEGERGPFHLGNDGMAVTVHGEMLVRLANLVAVVGSIDVAPEMRRIRGRPTDQPFGAGERQLQRVTGNGVLYLEPGKSLFHAIDLDDDGAYMREERVFAFEEAIAFENGRLTDAGKFVDLVNLKGQGRVLLQLDGPLKAMPIPVGSPMVVPLTRLVGWFGRVTPRMVGLAGLGAIELTGEGYALLGASERS